MTPDILLRDQLVAIATTVAPDPMWAAAALLAAANVVLGDALGDDEAREAIIGTYRQAADRVRH